MRRITSGWPTIQEQSAPRLRAASGCQFTQSPVLVIRQNTVALGDRASSNLKAHCGFDALSRKRWKKRWRHLYREFLEHAHRPRDVPVAQVDDRKIKDAEVPLRYDLNKAPVAH
jgi:hypothetical protein